MKPFYFAGLVKDLPGALLDYATERIDAQNRINAALLKGPLHTIDGLVRAASAQRRKIYERDKHGNMVCVGSYNTAGRAIRNIIERGY